MKKLFSLLIAAMFISVAAWAQPTAPHIVYGSSNDTGCSLTSKFFYSYYFTGATSQYRLEHSYGNGRKDTTSLANGQVTTLYCTYGTPGVYTSQAVLLQNNLRVDSMVLMDTVGDCILFDGRIYADLNGNCAFNDGTDPIIQRGFAIRIDSANIPVDTTYAYGTWRYIKKGMPLTPTAYRFTVLNPSSTLTSTCQTANSISVNYPGAATSLDFGYTCPGNTFDLASTHFAFLRSSTAGQSWISGTFGNEGCAPQAPTVTLKVSPKYTPVNFWPTPTSVSGNLITWNLPTMQGNAQTLFNVQVTPNAVYTAGDTAHNIVSMSPSAGDANPANNFMLRIDTIRAPVDPNDKSVSPAGAITAGTTLTYHINFENFGNDTAFNVYILDTLSPNLDASSFALVAASHMVRTSVIDGMGGVKILKAEFPNIRLAEVTQPLRNKGYVRFTMKAKNGLAGGTQIPNRAGIYFDFQPVVMTNTAMSTIGTPQSVELLSAAAAAAIHPNPATDRLTISNTDGTLASATLVSATGQVIRQWNLATGENTVSIEMLPTGIYFVQLNSAAGVRTEKLEKR